MLGYSARPTMLAQVREQSVRGLFDEVEHFLESVGAAVIRVRYFRYLALRRELEE